MALKTNNSTGILFQTSIDLCYNAHMKTINLPEKKYYIKKTGQTTTANIAIIIALMFVSGFFIYSALFFSGFSSQTHFPLLVVMIILALLSYYTKVPPPYIKLTRGKIKVRLMLIGIWKGIDLSDLESIAVRGNIIYLATHTAKPREIEIRLNRLNQEDAEELQSLLKKIVDNSPITSH